MTKENERGVNIENVVKLLKFLKKKQKKIVVPLIKSKTEDDWRHEDNLSEY
jgi:hypothetical protein